MAAEADLHVLVAEPAAPPSSDRTVTEPTFEGLTKLFDTGQPSPGLLSDEGGQFLGGHAMNSNKRQKTPAALSDFEPPRFNRRPIASFHATISSTSCCA
ncbi:DUF3987 domain-containing protein [Seohaeicola saemankumensis]|nr:DUF3987 domain-containing protein [Seohaeicola saemankumensis]